MMWSMQALLLMSAVSVGSAGIFTDDQVRKVETFVEEVMKCRQIPGQTVAVVQEDETWVRGFGLADIEQGVNVTKETLFGIGSLTKAFTTTLLAMMMDESNGSLTWTTKVKDVLGPDFAFVDEERTEETTLRDLLTHRAGLHPAGLAISAGFAPNFTTSDLAKRFRFLPEVHPFRDVYEYNNWAYALIGRIVEVLSGEPYEVTLEKRIFKPLGMNRSRVLGKTISANATGMAKPYYNVEDVLILSDPSIYDIHPGVAAGAIASSAEDMAKWMHFLLRQGVTEDNVTLVKYTTLVEVFKFHEYMPYGALTSKPQYPVMNLEYGYGYAWYLSVYKEYNVSMHTGALNAYTSYIKLYRDLDVGIFVSESGPGTSNGEFAENLISFYISDILIGDEPWLNVSTACSYPKPWGSWLSKLQNNSDVTNTDVDCLDCYVGKYGQYLFGDVDVRRGPGSSLDLQYGRLRGSLNTTDKKATFKLDLWHPFRFMSRPGNATILVEVLFRGLSNGKYSFIDLGLPHKMTFTRGTSFHDENIFTVINPEISATSVKELSNLLLVFASLCAVFSIL
ncbi:penicillin-binding protein 4-like [Haliotis rubra]|uniref:penicillin-binding protein 4-like n=1 Tax=Haliotis rubra TaxID=36100 RepID=UPI001EE55694|nr:penicillin-binding protein 4-like [Haliotis rubra]XP_046576016.1 penicillin-binding protein 4-like [Haliotis rubra]